MKAAKENPTGNGLKERLAALKLTVAAICRATGLSRPQVYRVLRGHGHSMRALRLVEAEITTAEAALLARFARVREMQNYQEETDG